MQTHYQKNKLPKRRSELMGRSTRIFASATDEDRVSIISGAFLAYAVPYTLCEEINNDNGAEQSVLHHFQLYRLCGVHQ